MTIHSHANNAPARTARRKLLTDRFAEELTTWGSPHVDDRARRLLELVDDAGFTIPAALDDPPPLRCDQPADDNSPGRQALRAQLCDRYGHPDPTAETCPRCGQPPTNHGRHDT